MRAALILAACAMLAACSKEPKRVDATDNGEFKVALLFTHDGCKVYRFEDGRSRYFVKCENGRARTETDDLVHYAKGATRYYPQSIDTVN